MPTNKEVRFNLVSIRDFDIADGRKYTIKTEKNKNKYLLNGKSFDKIEFEGKIKMN